MMLRGFSILFFVLILAGNSFLIAASSESACMEEAFEKLPLYFIENRGQLSDEVSFYVMGSEKTLYFTPKGVTMALLNRTKGDQGSRAAWNRWVVKLEFLGADADVALRGADKQQAEFNYFKGKPEEWKTALQAFGSLIYSELWPGIDLVYTGSVNQLKYTFVVKPGADPSQIRLAYRGATGVALTKAGSLKVDTPAGGFEDGRPYAFQEKDGKPVEISMTYAMEESRDGAFTYGFRIGEYDPSAPLHLDPQMMVYCGYIGGSNFDHGFDMAADDGGCAYIAGGTNSYSGFPVKVGPDLTYNSFGDAFVAKIAADGKSLVYCGFIGGNDSDSAYGIGVDPAGHAYVTGYTKSTQGTFPVKVGPDLSFNGDRDVFVAKVSTSGSALVYCGYIGGNGFDWGRGIAADPAGNAYVTGWTDSTQATFPVLYGPDVTYNGGQYDAFAAKVNADGKSLGYCGYIGGDENDQGEDIEVDVWGHAFVTGHTRSTQTTFPVVTGPDLTHNGGYDDVFVANVDSSGSGLAYCGYIGGAYQEYGMGIALDDQGCAYVTGYTTSDQTTFPVKIGPDLTFNGPLPSSDAFVAKVKQYGLGLDYCGYIGGIDGDDGEDIAVDHLGCAYVTGITGSDETSFPVKAGPDLTHNGGNDVFAAKVYADGSSLDYCGYIGGDDTDNAYGIDVDGAGDACVAGWTWSTEASFPVRAGPDLTHNGGTYDAFVAKIRMSLLTDVHKLSAATGGTVNYTLRAGAANAFRKYYLLGSMSGTQPGTLLPKGLEVLPLNWDAFTDLIVKNFNTPFFVNFMANLDASGNSTAQFNTFGPLPASFVGTVMHFSYALEKPWDFTSNPEEVEIGP